MVAEEQLRQRAVRNRAVMMDGANLMQIICKRCRWDGCDRRSRWQSHRGLWSDRRCWHNRGLAPVIVGFGLRKALISGLATGGVKG
jgi:hypothetical protein